jgi:hypothetical protein
MPQVSHTSRELDKPLNKLTMPWEEFSLLDPDLQPSLRGDACRWPDCHTLGPQCLFYVFYQCKIEGNHWEFSDTSVHYECSIPCGTNWPSSTEAATRPNEEHPDLLKFPFLHLALAIRDENHPKGAVIR